MLWIVHIALKNIGRNPSRSIISMASVFFAVVLSTLAGSLKEGIFNNLVNNVVGFYSGYLQIHAKGYWNERHLDHSFKEEIGLQNKIRQQNHIASFAPRLESFGLVASEKTTKGCLVVGIDPIAEHNATQIKNKLKQGNFISSNDTAVLCTEGLAARLNIKIGDTIYVIGQGFHGSTAAGKYPVKGILHFGAPQLNNQALFMPIAAAKNLFGTENRITAYVIQIKRPDQLEAITQSLRKDLDTRYEIMNWGEMMPDIKQHIETDSNNMKYVQGILYLLICFGIFGTLIMMMMERRYEMGMLIAIGMKKSALILMVIAESILTVMSGCVLGILGSIPLIQYLHRYPLKMKETTAKAYEEFGFEAVFPTATDARIFWEQGIAVLMIGIVLSLYPILQIIRLNPVEALKKSK
ncbi:MAG: ABC transporter permease [Bacteroidetes bacterium]|nr:ABC transporter permease [Bacteroidota bacterium]